MLIIEQDKVQRLKSGEFSEVDLDDWFSNHAFDYIFATIEGCDKKVDVSLLKFISMYAQYLLVNPNAKGWQEESLRELIKQSGVIPGNIDEMSFDELIDYWNKRIIEYCERILYQVILVGNKHQDYYGRIIEDLYTNENDTVRLYCAANSDYTKFLEDSSPRVRKVANIRNQFYQKWHNISDSDNDKPRIRFLKAALEKRAIQCYDGCTICSEEDKMYATFESLLFEKPISQFEFDSDIYYTISDRIILADALNEIIKKENISFREGMTPDCFKEEKNPVMQMTNNQN